MNSNRDYYRSLSPQPVNPGLQEVDVVSSVLPNGAATEAKQDVGNASLASIDGKVSTEVKQDVGNVILAAIAGSTDGLEGLATAGNASLASIDTNTKIGIRVSTGNSTIIPLGAGASFIGAWESTLQYQEVDLNLAGAPAAAPGTLFFEFSPDGVNADVSVPLATTGPSIVPQTLRMVLPYFRVRYVNGATPQTAFRLTVVYHYANSMRLTRFLNQVIDNTEPVENVRAVSVGQDPNGSFFNSPAGGTSAANTTTTPLGIAGVFTGAYLNQQGYGGITVAILTDQIGTLHVDSSNNGVTVVSTQSFSVMAGTAFFTGVAPSNSFVRVRYVNGGVAQTTMNLQTLVSTQQLPTSSQPINIPLNIASIANTVRAVLSAQKESGEFTNIGASNSGSIKVAVTDRPSEVRNRVFIKKFITGVSLVAAPGTIIHTVTVGKTFYLQALLISSLNASVATNGQWTLQDGTDTTDRIPFLMSQATAGAPAPQSPPPPSLPEPIPFTTDVRAIELAGDIIASITIVGYEE